MPATPLGECEEITSHYAKKGIAVYSSERVECDAMVCQACDICPTTYHYEASVAVGYADVLLSEGWLQKSQDNK